MQWQRPPPATRHEPTITHKPSIICAYSKGKLNWPVTQEAAANCGSQFLKRVEAKACKSRSGVTVTGLLRNTKRLLRLLME